MGLRVLVCGGRDYTNATRLEAELLMLDHDRGIDCIIHGNARGADTLANRAAKAFGWKTDVYPADWSKHGKSAGPIRNGVMLQFGKPDVVMAFPGGVGTNDMVKRARAAGVTVLEITL